MEKIQLYMGTNSALKIISKGTRFTTDVFIAMKHGKNVFEVDHSSKNFTLDKQEYFINKLPIKKFRKIGILN